MKRTELKRTTGLQRGTTRMARTPMARTSTKAGASARPQRTAAEQAAVDRDGPTCQRCGLNLEGRSASKHHRKRRREWDADRVENIVLLCGSGTTGCHGYVHHNKELARREGWVVWSAQDPAVIPCLTAYGSTGCAPPDANYTSMIMYLPDGTRVDDELPPVPLRAGGPDWPMWTAE